MIDGKIRKVHEVKIKKLRPDAKIPEYATDGSACFDFHAIEGGYVTENTPHVFDTGLSIEVPEEYVMLIFSRSGHGFKNDTRLANCVGVIDSDYRGEVKVKLTCDKVDHRFYVEPGDRIAQAMILHVNRVWFVEVDELSPTERGFGGFGSTGA